MRSSLTTEEWCQARNAVEAGESLRAVAERLGVSHTTLSRAARRDGWSIPPPPWAAAAAQKPPKTPQTPVYGDRETSSGDRPTEAPQARQRGAERPSEGEMVEAVDNFRGRPSRGAATPKAIEWWEPPEDEMSARLWHCPRCRLSGFDPNRRERAWHDQALCDQRMRRLDVGLDDRPRPFDAMTAQW